MTDPANAASREARAAIDRAARFAKGLNTTPEEHDDIMVAVDLARAALADEAASQSREGACRSEIAKAICEAMGDDPAREGP
jgi:hypothetical protein